MLMPHKTDGFMKMSKNEVPNQTIAELRDSITWMDVVISNLSEGVIVVDKDGTIQYANDSFAKIFGVQRIFFLGLYLKEILPEVFRSLGPRGSIQMENLQIRDYVLNLSGSNSLVFDIIVTPLIKKIDQRIIVLYDITRRKKSDQELCFQNALLKAQCESSMDAILLVSSEGKMIYFNRHFVEMWGISEEIIAARSDEAALKSVNDQLVHPQEFLARVTYLYEHPEEKSHEEILLKDGRILDRYSSPIKGLDGTHYGRVWYFRDITEHRWIEEKNQKLKQQLFQSEKMGAVGQLAAGLAHEINNPLGVILGFAQGMMKRIKEDHSFFLPVQSIERESLRCKNLVQDLLTFSRVDPTQNEECDLNHVIRGALSFVQAQAKVRSVELVEQFDEDIPKLSMNRNQIQEVILNLCNNGIDAMPKGGTLTIQTRKIEKDGGEFAEIQVTDEGMGIPKEIHAKIFEPFFTTKEVGKGTGLGLSLVHEIIQKHQGKIEVSSHVEKGTTFRILLPLTGKCCDNASTNNLILIVEDEPEIMSMIKRALAYTKMKFITTSSGFEAGKLLAENNPTLIILDVFLPGVDGFRICEMIRKDNKLKGIKILAISGTAAEQTAKKIIRHGADDFLGKPFGPEELRSRVSKLVKMERKTSL